MVNAKTLSERGLTARDAKRSAAYWGLTAVRETLCGQTEQAVCYARAAVREGLIALALAEYEATCHCQHCGMVISDGWRPEDGDWCSDECGRAAAGRL